jgi:surface protein
MSNIFAELWALENLNISNITTNKVTDMSYMFTQLYSLSSLDLSHFDTSKVTNMNSMFRETNIVNLNLNTWNLVNLTTYERLFEDSKISSLLMNNSNYNSINIIISILPTKTIDAAGNLSIIGVDDLSQVNSIDATNKYWTVTTQA